MTDAVFVRIEAVPVTIPVAGGPDLRVWQGRLRPDLAGAWVWTCEHRHAIPATARWCASSLLDLLSRHADGDPRAAARIRRLGGRHEHPPDQPGCHSL